MSESVTATYVFTDLVGSTQLASSMSAERADELRRRHFALLRSAIESTGGREVKNLGDGLMIVFSSASRAFSCAVEIQQAFERHNRRGGVALEVRIGLGTGEAIEDEGDFFGDPVVEAARLCARAAPGQILATELARLTVGRHAPLEFAPLGELELKGLSAAVPAVEVCWEPTSEEGRTGAPLPGRLSQYATGGLFGFSGRETELALLGELGKQASTEQRLGVALVAGEPGVGKSCLAAHAALSAQREDMTVLFGECAEGSHAPYLPWIGALSHLVRHAEPSALEGLSPVHAWALGRLLPADAGFLPAQETVDAEADTEQFLLVQAVAAVLELASAETPVFIVLDDLQWADSSSLSLLRHLFGTGSNLKCLIVGTFRPESIWVRAIPWSRCWRICIVSRRAPRRARRPGRPADPRTDRDGGRLRDGRGRSGPRPRIATRDGRQSVLCRRAVTPSGRVWRYHPGRLGPLLAGGRPRRTGAPSEHPRMSSASE